ncbi:MAG: hypothetical protein KC502_16030 [Myxococcales bacterium]|nr:hypothetical protein [Myxococcales bacterium]
MPELHSRTVALMPRALAASTLALVMGVITSGCGAQGPQRLPKAFEAGSPRAAGCKTLVAQRASEIERKKFLPPALVVHHWPKPAAVAKPGETQGATVKAQAPRRISEGAFANLLVQGHARGTLVLARGGSGKSKLAWSLEAQLCGVMPVTRVDLQWDVAAVEQREKDANPLLLAVVKHLGLKTAKPAKALDRALGAKPWLLLLDSLDEIPLDQRTRVVKSVNQAMVRFPALRIVVFSRPPVFRGNYGLAHTEGLVELPQLSCARTDELAAKLITKAGVRTRFDTLMQRYSLNRKAKTSDGACYYPHVSTYRDFFVLRSIAQNQPMKAEPKPTWMNSRARVYEFFLTVILVKDMQGVGMLPKTVIETVDEMVSKKHPADTVRNLTFDLADCMAAAPPKHRTKSICERLLQSSLFDHGGKLKAQTRFKLRNQSLADLFLARYTADLIDVGGCKVITRRAALFESNEVAGFLAGTSAGQSCLAPLARQLCNSGGFARHNFEQLDQGLPSGPERLAMVKAAQASLPKTAAPDLCLTMTLDRLRKSVGKPRPPVNAPAPPAPGK